MFCKYFRFRRDIRAVLYSMESDSVLTNAVRSFASKNSVALHIKKVNISATTLYCVLDESVIELLEFFGMLFCDQALVYCLTYSSIYLLLALYMKCSTLLLAPYLLAQMQPLS